MDESAALKIQLEQLQKQIFRTPSSALLLRPSTHLLLILLPLMCHYDLQTAFSWRTEPSDESKATAEVQAMSRRPDFDVSLAVAVPLPPLAADELAPSKVEVLEQDSSDFDSDVNDDNNVRIAAIEATLPLQRSKISAPVEATSTELSPSDLFNVTFETWITLAYAS
jgi:hypothetical protein